MKIFTFFIFLLLLLSCAENHTIDTNAVKKEIADAEKAFETMAKEKGIAEAFVFYADSNAVIRRRNDTLITGKEGIRKFYSGDLYKEASVTWSPDFIDVSEKGDMAYTYGKYLWQSKDSTGKPIELSGVFHTVWKRQKDGSWRYVWD
jgi:ketosteroid isomerase-like protein